MEINKNKLKIIDKNNNLEERKEGNLKKITLMSIGIFILILFLTGYSIGKSIQDTTLKSNAGIAEPIFTIESNPAIDITASETEGRYQFKVKNFNEEEKVTEVDLEYWIEIQSDLENGITYTLYKGEEEISINNGKSEKQEIKKGEKREESYQLKVNYNKNETNKTEDILEKIQIKIHSQQVKG